VHASARHALQQESRASSGSRLRILASSISIMALPAAVGGALALTVAGQPTTRAVVQGHRKLAATCGTESHKSTAHSLCTHP
jgi:hypothetical protein